MKATLIQFWETQLVRQRTLWTTCAICLILLIIFSFLLEPLKHRNQQLHIEVQQLRTQAARMERAGAELAQLRANTTGAATSASQLTAVLETTAKTHGLPASVISTSSDNAARSGVQLANVPFNTWVTWVDELHRKHRMWLVSSRIIATDTPGMVRIDAQFSAAVPLKRNP